MDRSITVGDFMESEKSLLYLNKTRDEVRGQLHNW